MLRLLDEHAPLLLDAPEGEALARLPGEGPGVDALRCAVDSALLDLEGRRAGTPAAALLADRPAASVLVNAVIGDGPPESRQPPSLQSFRVPTPYGRPQWAR